MSGEAVLMRTAIQDSASGLKARAESAKNTVSFERRYTDWRRASAPISERRHHKQTSETLPHAYASVTYCGIAGSEA